MVDYDPILHTHDEGQAAAEENRELFVHRFTEEREAVSDIDPQGPGMKGPHEHRTHRTRQIGKDVAGKTEICACGARRDISLTKSSPWVGGNIPMTGWEKAHLEAVRRAVENTEELLALQPQAVQNINEALKNDPAKEVAAQDQKALAHIYGVARGAAHRLIDFKRNNPDPE